VDRLFEPQSSAVPGDPAHFRFERFKALELDENMFLQAQVDQSFNDVE
jgi:hypothetical protein